jgi:hypothetical protein
MPRVLGILHVTPDSFSGDGRPAEAAILRGRAMIAAGADPMALSRGIHKAVEAVRRAVTIGIRRAFELGIPREGPVRNSEEWDRRGGRRQWQHVKKHG